MVFKKKLRKTVKRTKRLMSRSAKLGSKCIVALSGLERTKKN